LKLRLLFICGSLESGKDGVGDYTIRIAEELAQRGCYVSVIAMYDRYIDHITLYTQTVNLTSINCLRIPHKISIKEKFKALLAFVHQHNPEWISLQYVPFSFHDKGIPFRLSYYLKQLNKQVQWHIMFHELWIGTHGARDLKTILWRRLQKLIIKRLIFQLQPQLITTTIKKYLQLINVQNAKLLPLFGNIPLVMKEESDIRPDLIKVVIYGSVTSCLDEFRKQILWLKKLSLQLNRKISFVFIGNNGINKCRAEGIIKNEFGASSQKSIGFVSKDTVSCHLTTADLGISRADYTYLGKSGTTISMLEHGLPVLLKGKRPLLPNQENNELIQKQLFYPDDPLPISLIKYPKTCFLQSVTDQYIQFLQHASGK
jgi:hypothetical protein